MNFADIERAINEFGEKVNKKIFPLQEYDRNSWSFSQARSSSLSIEDMDGGTFTISNGGVFRSLFGTPILNPPQTAILGMHGIFDRPVVINGKVCRTFIAIFLLSFQFVFTRWKSVRWCTWHWHMIIDFSMVVMQFSSCEKLNNMSKIVGRSSSNYDDLAFQHSSVYFLSRFFVFCVFSKVFNSDRYFCVSSFFRHEQQ